MAKNNKNETKNETTANSLSRLAEIAAKKAALKAQMAALAKEEEETQDSISEEVAEKVRSLPAMFGVADLPAVWALLRDFRQGVSSGKGGRKSSIPEETQKAILDLIRKAKAPGATAEEATAGSFSALADKFGFNAQNIRNLAIKSGLHVVKSRDSFA